jgi:hypothetical protein
MYPKKSYLECGYNIYSTDYFEYTNLEVYTEKIL